MIASFETAELLRALAQDRATYIAALNRAALAIPMVTSATQLATAPDHSIIHRIGTSNSAQFPVGGFDPIDDGAWCQRIFGDKQPIIANNAEQMGNFIPETDDLVALGIEAIMCLPIVIDAQMRGTINIMGKANSFSPPIQTAALELLPFAALLFTFEGIDLP